ncbi:hypothetical protein B0H12DRAFT_1072588 [Mycena haematopus]|nr:hypothetical protein B0H12DRAFT_1072588 [Mycena haematopus]
MSQLRSFCFNSTQGTCAMESSSSSSSIPSSSSSSQSQKAKARKKNRPGRRERAREVEISREVERCLNRELSILRAEGNGEHVCLATLRSDLRHVVKIVRSAKTAPKNDRFEEDLIEEYEKMMFQ